MTTAARQFSAVVVTGARQTGKTTLFRGCFPDHHYVTLELPSATDLAEREPEQFIRAHPLPLLIVASILRERSVAPHVTSAVVCRTPHESRSVDKARIVSIRQLAELLNATENGDVAPP